MKTAIKHLAAAAMLAATVSCSQNVQMQPDYRDATVPCNIAPLNFCYSGARCARTTFTAGGESVTIRGKDVRIATDDWQRLLAAATDGDICVSSNVQSDWAIHVSADSIDNYLTYRLIEPGYEVWDRVEIRERQLSSFDERPISSWTNTNNSCMNCHTHKGGNSMFYLRGPKGGAILNRNGSLRKLNLRAEGMISSTVYGDLSPDGRWGVFSTNIIIPGFHTAALERMEIYDKVSDLTIADFDSNRMLNPQSVTRKDKLETFPCFSADGQKIYYCSADATALPDSIGSLRYSLMQMSFDPATGRTGTPEVLLDGPANGLSVCHPKASPDGRWLMFTVAGCGTFPIWHRECDLALLDLETGKTTVPEIINSDRSDTYHSWSSNSRWFVFASKRGDGAFGKPYICHIDANGNCGRPFVLPQQDPHHYERTLKSYNIPDLGICPAPYDTATVARMRNEMEAEPFR